MSNETVTLTPELISALKAAGYRLEAIKPEAKQGGRYKPKDGDVYWYSGGDSLVCQIRSLDDKDDRLRYSIGNCYSTREEATAARDRQLALVRVQDRLEELADEPVDWSDGDQFKYELLYRHSITGFRANAVNAAQTLGGLYGSKAACKWVIDNMESDLKLIAGIE